MLLAFQTPETKDLSSMLHKALEGAIILKSFRKTTVDVFALVLESGGSDLPVITTCASVAHADAGILLYDIVASVLVCYDTDNLIKRFTYNLYIWTSVTLYLDVLNLFLTILRMLKQDN